MDLVKISASMRLLVLFAVLVALILIPFFIWGESLTAFFTLDATKDWLQQYDQWAWALGLLLLLGDLLLPLPGTIIMSALGYVYGPIWGGLFAALGSFLSGLLGYMLCRMMGRKGARWVLGEKGLARGEQLFARAGGWLVVLSRWLPVFPEVVACMAGLSRMRTLSFIWALACGSLPLGFAFAWIGHAGVDHPGLAIGLSAGIPPLLWWISQRYFRQELSKAEPKP